MISVVACTKRFHYIHNIISNFKRQSLPEKELILIMNISNVDWDSVDHLLMQHNIKYKLYQFREEISLGECLNYGVRVSSYDTVAKFDDDDYYGPHYLAEAHQTMNRVGADLVGKCSFYIYFKEKKELRIYNPNQELKWVPTDLYQTKSYNWKNFMSGASLVFKKSVIDEVTFPHVNVGEDSQFQEKCAKRELKMYSLSKSNYVYIRYSAHDHHTSDSKEYPLKKWSRWVHDIEEGRLYQVVDDYF